MSKIPKSSNKSIHDALRVLARDIQSEDGAANVAIAEAADRISELDVENDRLHLQNAALRELTNTLGAPNHINIPVEKWHELQEDKERLNWMASADYWADIAVYRTPKGLRAAIDAARKEAQP